ncbi:ABC transporter ATP-binding protein [Parafilimonas terrae]|uniref:ABC-type multidrug transport system, ATPase component n=1 Tax=Parafilimonas terrae TaxID=1465490 RepID=A0A1I5SUN2_9BACT|nr:ATP-binding cassette domain-containing protein [Parafilimonas terrae]SFP74475.1 ABC-type multidrug transport system, ATPase component [Parafilimonas terrae]
MKIKLTNAGKRFSREWIFRNLSYDFLPGVQYAITGPNGSGKSTLLQAIAGASTLNEGGIEWQPGNKNIQPEETNSYISIAAPYLELIEEMTAKEFLLFHSNFKKFIQNIPVETILEEADLAQAANKQIRFFSSGMKQRLKLAQAFFSDVPVVLLDEPCTNLDAAGFALYYKWIENYSNGRLVIISSNDKNEFSFCSQQLNILDFKL